MQVGYTGQIKIQNWSLGNISSWRSLLKPSEWVRGRRKMACFNLYPNRKASPLGKPRRPGLDRARMWETDPTLGLSLEEGGQLFNHNALKDKANSDLTRPMLTLGRFNPVGQAQRQEFPLGEAGHFRGVLLHWWRRWRAGSSLPGCEKAEQNIQVPSEGMASTKTPVSTGWTDTAGCGEGGPGCGCGYQDSPCLLSVSTWPGGGRRQDWLGPHTLQEIKLLVRFLPCSGKAQKASDAEPSDVHSYSRIRVEEGRDRAVHNIHICQDKEGRGRKKIRQGKHSDNVLYTSVRVTGMQERSGSGQLEGQRTQKK